MVSILTFQAHILGIDFEAVGINRETPVVGQLIPLNTGYTEEVGHVLTERKSADIVGEGESRITGGTPLCVVGHTPTDSTASISESEGSNARRAYPIGVDAAELHSLTDVACVQEETITTFHTRSILVFGTVDILRLTLPVISQIFVDLADEANLFCCILAAPRTSNQASLAGRTSTIREIEAVGDGTKSLGESEPQS